MTKEDIKKKIREEFPGNPGLIKYLYSVVDGDVSLAVACRYCGIGAASQESVNRLIAMQNQLWDETWTRKEK
jgi:hypothetical protein